MHQKQRDLQKRFEGFLKTPSLWVGNTVEDIQQFELLDTVSKIDIVINEKQRLGKYVEEFAFFQLKQHNFNVVLVNVQIQKGKLTLGELDCIVKKGDELIHIELVYKFYLFIDKIGSSEIDCFIGPNQRDSLKEKLQKLKKKQLPLLYSNECAKLLSNKNLDINLFKQQVSFKAQLFIPFQNSNIHLESLNPKCIVGFYINKRQLDEFDLCKFYIPNKKDWLVIPHPKVDWLSFEKFKIESSFYLKRKFSPLFWMKQKSGKISKFFLVWW